MAKLMLITGFVLVLSTLAFAAANTSAPGAPSRMLVGGQLVDVSYD